MTSLQQFIELSEKLENKESSLQSLLKEGQKDLAEIELPHRRMENWKYTNLNDELNQSYKMVSTPGDFQFEKLEGFINLFFLDNKFKSEFSDSSAIKITDINIADPVLLTSNSQQYYQDDIIDTLNKSMMHDGHIFEISEKTEKPIFIHRHYTQKNAAYNLTNLINAKEFSKVSILENITSSDSIYLNIATHAISLDTATIEHIQIQDTKKGSLVLNSIYGSVFKNGNYENVIINTGAKKSRTNLAISLQEPEARCSAHGLYALHEDQHHDTLSYIHHAAPHTNSFQLYKGILGDKSRGVFTGKVRVEKNSQLINAEQLNKNLLLSKKAQANSRPQLEIYADDVKCSHGSTTGQLSESELFYFESRGIRKEKARQMLARAFAYDVILKIEDLKIQNFCKNHLLSKNIVS